MRINTIKILPIPGLRSLDGLCAQHDVHGARDAAARQLRLHLLDPHLLEVHKPRLVEVKLEPGPVVTHGVPADGRLRVLELLLNTLERLSRLRSDKINDSI